MTIDEVIKKYDLNDSFLLGFYGGGNYGDELLLEVLQNLLHQQGYERVSFLYQQPAMRSVHHHDFGYQAVDARSKGSVLRTLFQRHTIIVGGGGLWGMDINTNVLLMSVMLLIARRLLGKKVMLLGVGYYGTTSRMGHIGAWCAAKAANLIVARDQETFDNFSTLNSETYLDQDIAWSLPELNLREYHDDLTALDARLPIGRKTIFITLRHFKPGFKQNFDQHIEAIIHQNPKRPIIAALLEPKSADPAHWRQLQRWRRQFSNVHIIDFSYNPIALYLFFRRHNSELTYIGPQFHAILTSHLSGVPYMRISYDNKVQALLETLGVEDSLPISKVSTEHIQQFIAE